MGHTPGPWLAVRGGYGWHIGPQPDGVCSIHDNSGGYQHDRQAANARLIAAAPELLAACERAADLVKLARQHFPRSIRNSDTFALEQCNAAICTGIAKAKGDEPAPMTEAEMIDEARNRR